MSAIVITLALTIAAWLFYVSQENAITNGMMNSIAKNNERLVRSVADQIERNASNEDEALEILSSTTSDGVSYWSLFSEESLIFEKNELTTEQLSGFSYNQD